MRASILMGLAIGCGHASGPTPTESTPSPVPTEPDATTVQIESDLFVARYGKGTPALVFLHGGPGYNSALFEATAAESLGSSYEIVVYDRRGSGRNPEVHEADAYTFDQAIADLDAIVAPFDAPVLLAHSFGGAVALRYLDARPDFTGRVVLVNAPISYPRSLQTILANCRTVYEAAGDADNLGNLDQIEALDPASSQYVGFTFSHGLSCGLYQVPDPTDDATARMRAAAQHPAAAHFSTTRPQPFLGFHQREQYSTMDLSELVTEHRDRVAGIYAAQDRIIADEDRAFLREQLGERFIEIDGAAHNVFVDQYPAFADAVATLVADSPPL